MTQGWRILLLDTKSSNPNHYLALALAQALRQNPDVGQVVKADYGNALERAREHRCNLFFAFDGEELDQALCKRLADLCGTSIAWFTEDPYEVPINQQTARLFDLVFTNDRGSVAAYGAKGRHLPLAASTELHRFEVPADDSHYRYDLFFAGTAWPNRVKLLKTIQSRIQGLKVKLALPFNEHLPIPDLALPASSYQWRTPNLEFCRIANRSRIVLTLHRAFSASGGKAAAETPGPRLFEIAMAGACQLVDTTVSGVEDYLAEGSEFASFDSPETCVAELRALLADPDRRLQMARAAQQRISAEHTYANRVAEILDELEHLPARSAPAAPVKAQQPARPRVLIVSHNMAGTPPYGGVEVYQRSLIQALGDTFEFLFYVPVREALIGQRFQLLDAAQNQLEQLEFAEWDWVTNLSSPERERAFANLLVRHRIDLVHFQHLLTHPPSLPHLCRALGIPAILTVHDYYAICKSFNLIGYDGRYCAIAERPEVACDVCLAATDQALPGSQAIRRAFWAGAMAQLDLIHANSQFTRAMLAALFPELDAAGTIAVAGIPLPTDNKEALSAAPTNQPLRIAVIGNFTILKGADPLIRLFALMAEDPVEFHILGSVNEPYDTILANFETKNLEVHGSYQADAVPEWLSTMDLSLHLSIWPETYSITLSEVWSAGLIPIVADIGALGERVAHGVNGFKVPPGDVGAAIALLRELIVDPSPLQQMREQISPALYPSLDEHADWLSRTYRALIARRPMAASGQPNEGRDTLATSLTLQGCGVRLVDPNWLRRTPSPLLLGPAPGRGARLVALARAAYRYLQVRGLRATLARIVLELRRRIEQRIRKQ